MHSAGVVFLQAGKATVALLRPLEVLTRALPPHLRGGGGGDDPELSPALASLLADVREEGRGGGGSNGGNGGGAERVERAGARGRRMLLGDSVRGRCRAAVL